MKIIEIRELNPYEQNSTLKMRADFYTVEIAKDINLKPNDLPALIEIPKEKFYDIKLASNLSMRYIKDYIIKNEEEIRLKKLQLQYDNEEIDEDDLSEEEIEKLVVLYEKETEELNADTKRRKIHIQNMLKEMKN